MHRGRGSVRSITFLTSMKSARSRRRWRSTVLKFRRRRCSSST